MCDWPYYLLLEVDQLQFLATYYSSLGAPTVTLQKLMFGDVFLCSGQSNMASVQIQVMPNATAIVRHATELQDGMRIFTVGNIPGYAKTQSNMPLNQLQTNGHP